MKRARDTSAAAGWISPISAKTRHRHLQDVSGGLDTRIGEEINWSLIR